MVSTSIQGRVDSEVWHELKQTEETNTQVLQRLTAHYVATSGDELLEIAPTFDAAVAVLLNSHRLLNQLMQNAAVAAASYAQRAALSITNCRRQKRDHLCRRLVANEHPPSFSKTQKRVVASTTNSPICSSPETITNQNNEPNNYDTHRTSR